MHLNKLPDPEIFEERVQNSLNILDECASWKYFELKRKGISISKNELVTIGYMGLHDASQRFDSSKNDDFEGFAKHYINLAILSYQRGIDKVDHRVRSQIKEISKVKESLTQTLGRIPSTKEIAKKMQMDEDKIYSLLKTDPKQVEIDNEYIDGSYNLYHNSDQADSRIDIKEREENLGRDMNDCINTALNHDQKKIIELLFIEEKTAKDIALLLWQKFDKKEKTYIYNTTKNGKLKLKKCMGKKGWSITDV